MLNASAELLPRELAQRFAQVGSQEGKSDPLALARCFVPGAGASWYMLEYDPENRQFFGWANLYGSEKFWELGSIALDELQSLDIKKHVAFSPPGEPGDVRIITLRVYRDLDFTERPLSQVTDLPPRCAELHAEAARNLAADAD